MSDEDSAADWMQNYQQRIAQEQEKARQAISVLCSQLVELGVDTVHVEYDGYGDSGTIEQVRGLVNENEVAIPANLADDLATAIEMLLPDGWQDNNGAFGVFVINVARRRMTREHNWRVESSEYEEEEWPL